MNRKLEFHNFIQGANAHHKANPTLRKGQAYCNWAAILRQKGEISFALTPEEEVCFYDDSKISDFLSIVSEHMGNS